MSGGVEYELWLCAGCFVREPFEHRCHAEGEICRCDLCEGRACSCRECADPYCTFDRFAPPAAAEKETS